MGIAKEIPEEQQQYRDILSKVTNEGKRNWVYAKKPRGRFYNARTWFSILLLGILFGVPFMRVAGHPFMLFDILERKFILFGLAFGPHDFYLFALAMLSFIVFIILFTVVFGRVFCGWACPQTVFLEMVFRKIEFWIEGDYLSQKRLDKAHWTAGKIFKKGSKWTIFFALSVVIANTLLAWIVGTDELFKIITDPVSEHTGGFISMILFSGGFFFIFSWFREQACILVCPYGRLQGVLLDSNSLVIAYDSPRGEPRGKINKRETRTHGDCIDCNECVVVCPTGIDIRNGTQLECVNCTACIDACNNVMDKVKLPRGLIKFASEKQITEKSKLKISARIIGYSIVLIGLLVVLSLLLINRKPVDVTILRSPGMLFQEQPGGMLSNLYSIKLVNKTFDDADITLNLKNSEGKIQIMGNPIKVDPDGVGDARFMVLLSKEKITKMNTPIEIEVLNKGIVIGDFKTTFLGSVTQN